MANYIYMLVDNGDRKYTKFYTSDMIMVVHWLKHDITVTDIILKPLIYQRYYIFSLVETFIMQYLWTTVSIQGFI